MYQVERFSLTWILLLYNKTSSKQRESEMFQLKEGERCMQHVLVYCSFKFPVLTLYIHIISISYASPTSELEPVLFVRRSPMLISSSIHSHTNDRDLSLTKWQP